MEPDRYSSHHKLYVLGIVSLLLALSLFFFSIYILPFLLWNLYYNVPGFVSDMIMYFENECYYSPGASKIVTWMIFFIPSLITGYVSYYISNYIDNQLLGLDVKSKSDDVKESNQEVQRDIKESLGLAGKIILLMILMVILILLLQVFVQNTP